MVGGSSQKSKLVFDQEGKITGEGFSETYNNKPIVFKKRRMELTESNIDFISRILLGKET